MGIGAAGAAVLGLFLYKAQVGTWGGDLSAEQLFQSASNAVVLIEVFDDEGHRRGLGSGFVVSEDGLAVTNYHVIRGASRASTKFADGTLASVIGVMGYDPERDVAVIKIERVAQGALALGNSDQLQVGQRVVAIGSPMGFQNSLSDGLVSGMREGFIQTTVPISPGSSGGLIVDRKTHKAVGVLRGVERNSDLAAAIPVWSLADFFKKVQPEIYSEIFPSKIYRPNAELDVTERDVELSVEGISPESILADSYQQHALTNPILPLPRNSSDTLQRRQRESPDIQQLRRKAQSLVDDMKNFIAVQTLSYGGGTNPITSSRHEVRVMNGHQVFRELPDGKLELSRLPYQKSNPVLVMGAEWSTLPNMVGNNLKLQIHQVMDASVDGRKVKVFRYRGEIEDHACEFRSTTDFIFFQRDWVGAVACSGEVWTDENMNILRINNNSELPPSRTKWRNLHAVVTYGWLKKPKEEAKLIPVNISIQAEFDNRVYWCKGRFTNYQMFSVEANLLGQ